MRGAGPAVVGPWARCFVRVLELWSLRFRAWGLGSLGLRVFREFRV